MAKTKKSTPMPGWSRVTWGIELITWSKLAAWDGSHLAAANDENSFDAEWLRIDPKFGRWLCWIAFGVGSEGIVKGAFGIRNHFVENFGGCHPWNKRLSMPTEHVAQVSDAITYLATEVRNRDAHQYLYGVRSKDFPDVAGRFVPALNRVLDCLGDELLLKVKEHYASNSAKFQT
jgi:hypothetical protein